MTCQAWPDLLCLAETHWDKPSSIHISKYISIYSYIYILTCNIMYVHTCIYIYTLYYICNCTPSGKLTQMWKNNKVSYSEHDLQKASTQSPTRPGSRSKCWWWNSKKSHSPNQELKEMFQISDKNPLCIPMDSHDGSFFSGTKQKIPLQISHKMSQQGHHSCGRDAEAPRPCQHRSKWGHLPGIRVMDEMLGPQSTAPPVMVECERCFKITIGNIYRDIPTLLTI